MHVMVVEDDIQVRSVIARLLDRDGFAVDAFATAEEAILPGAERRYDLAILDAVLPQRSGADLARYLAEAAAGTPLIFMSGYPEDHLSSLHLPRGVPVLRKPFNVEQLRAAAWGALGWNASFAPPVPG